VPWLLLGCLATLLAAGLVLARREELARMAEMVAVRERQSRSSANRAQLQHPVVDLARCLGCGTCVAACPEDGVLELVHGQAVVVRAARCVGVAACERECPVAAITVTIANLAERDDVPAVDSNNEAIDCPNVFLVGEVTALALVRTAVQHGVRVVREIALRVAGTALGAEPAPGAALDLLIVGAGPAGMAASLEAQRIGLRYVTLEQESGPGGTVAKYPRGKLVITEPVELPLHGRLRKNAYHKEELIALWTDLGERHGLAIRYAEPYERLERDATTGHFHVWSKSGVFTARNVVFAVGRRGSPRKLGIPGEGLEKVRYSLDDATAYVGQRLAVIGGGDAAVEAALGLAEQPGNRVLLSYRSDEFVRIRARNAARLEAAIAAQTVEVITRSEVVAVDVASIDLTVADGPSLTRRRVENDAVFVLTGGTAPIELLGSAGVSFDPSLRVPLDAAIATDTSPQRELVRALASALVLTLLCCAFVLYHRDYYVADARTRATHPLHDLLRPGRGLGLIAGCGALGCIALNLCYLLRRSGRLGFTFGSLRLWMNAHVTTGVLAFLLCAVHAALAPRDTVGGHALVCMAVLLGTGAIGRYLYAWVPRAANGRELELDAVRAELWNERDLHGDTFAEEARAEVIALVEHRQWRGHLLGRLLALAGVRRDLRRALRRVEGQGFADGVARERIDAALALARRAHRLALEAAHFEDLRGLLSGWRWVHRWVTALMLALVLLHVAHALMYGGLLTGGRPGSWTSAPLTTVDGR